MTDPKAGQPDPADAEERELEENPVAQRLRRLSWPRPRPEAKQRGLEEIMRLVRERGGGGRNGGAAPADSDQDGR